MDDDKIVCEGCEGCEGCEADTDDDGLCRECAREADELRREMKALRRDFRASR